MAEWNRSDSLAPGPQALRMRIQKEVTMLHRILVGLCAMFSLSQAAGQSIPGDFQNFDPWWTGLGGSLGVRYDPPPQTLQIDRNYDGVTDMSYSRPSGPNGLTGSELLRLL